MADGEGMGDFLRLLAERAATDPAYIGWVVHAYAEAEARTTADVVTQLGVAEFKSTDFLVSLRPAGKRFDEMLTAICVRFGADDRMLLTILREVEVLEAFRAGAGGAVGGAAADAGLLMAARMRNEKARRRREDKNPEAHHDDERGGDEGSDAR